MPTKARSPRTSRPAGGIQSKPKVKFWVLWEPPAQMLLFVGVAVLFAGIGLAAIRYSNAQIGNDKLAGDLAVLWQDEPDSAIGSIVTESTKGQKVLQNWRSSLSYIYGGGSVKVVSDTTKGRALEFFGVADGARADSYGRSQRAEQIADLDLKKGRTYWFGFDLFVAPGGGVSSGRQTVWRLLPQPDKSPAKLWLALNSNQEGLAMETDQVSLPVGPVPDQEWSRLTIGVHIETDNRAWLEVWRDGKVVLDKRAVDGGVISPNVDSAVASAGIYRSAQPWDVSVRMAHLKIGATKDAVQ